MFTLNVSTNNYDNSYLFKLKPPKQFFIMPIKTRLKVKKTLIYLV